MGRPYIPHSIPPYRSITSALTTFMLIDPAHLRIGFNHHWRAIVFPSLGQQEVFRAWLISFISVFLSSSKFEPCVESFGLTFKLIQVWGRRDGNCLKVFALSGPSSPNWVPALQTGSQLSKLKTWRDSQMLLMWCTPRVGPSSPNSKLD